MSTPEGRRSLYQACYDMVHPETRDREISALLEAMIELSIGTGTIITGDTHETIHANGHTIKCVPLWQWLLQEK